MQSIPSSSSSLTSLAADTRRAPRRIWVWAGLEALVAFALAMTPIDARSIWYDESVSATASRSQLRELPRIASTFDPPRIPWSRLRPSATLGALLLAPMLLWLASGMRFVRSSARNRRTRAR